MSIIPQAKDLENPPTIPAATAANEAPSVLLSEVKRFYVVDKNHTTFVSFWRPGAQGRTHDLNQAGTWTAQELVGAYFRHNPELIFISVDSITEAMKNVVVFNRDLPAVQP